MKTNTFKVQIPLSLYAWLYETLSFNFGFQIGCEMAYEKLLSHLRDTFRKPLWFGGGRQLTFDSPTFPSPQPPPLPLPPPSLIFSLLSASISKYQYPLIQESCISISKTPNSHQKWTRSTSIGKLQVCIHQFLKTKSMEKN